MSKMNDFSFIRDIKCTMLRITFLNAVVLKYIFVYNLLHYNTVHHAYAALLTSDWDQPPVKLASTQHSMNFSLNGL